MTHFSPLPCPISWPPWRTWRAPSPRSRGTPGLVLHIRHCGPSLAAADWSGCRTAAPDDHLDLLHFTETNTLLIFSLLQKARMKEKLQEQTPWWNDDKSPSTEAVPRPINTTELQECIDIIQDERKKWGSQYSSHGSYKRVAINLCL